MKRQRPPAATLRGDGVRVTRVTSAGLKLELLLGGNTALVCYDFPDVAIGDSVTLHGLHYTITANVS